jgi:hypothetical protein
MGETDGAAVIDEVVYGAYGNLVLRLRRRWTITRTTMAMIAIELTTPPTIAGVCELLPPERDTASEDEEAGAARRGVVTLAVGTPVGGGEVVLLPVGPVLEGLDPPINVPGPISGLSERRR